MRKAAKFIAVTAVLPMLLLMVSCGRGGTTKIGFIGFLTGADAYLGQSAKLALEDYIADMNAKGGLQGKKVELVAYDIGMDPNTETVNAANRLIQQDKVCAIIGPESSEQAIVAIPIANTAMVPIITTTASNVKVTVGDDGKVHPYMFRMCFIDPYQGTALANFAYKKLNLRKTAFLGDVTNIYTQGIQQYYEDAFIKLGGEAVSKQGFVPTDVEYRAQLSKIKESNADSILIATGSYKVVAFVAKQAKQLGVKAQLLGVDGWYASELMDLAGKELEGAYMTNGVTESDPMFAEYNAKFKEKHPGQSANIYAYYALDAMKAIEYAVTKTKSADPKKIKDAIENMKDVQLFTSKVTIEPDTHNPHNKPVTVLRITDSQYKTYEIYQPED